MLFDVIAELHHSFFIRSPVDGHLDCLEFLRIMHKAALKHLMSLSDVCFYFSWV